MTPEKTPPRSIVGGMISVLFLFLLMITAFLVVLSFPAGVYTVFFANLSNSTSAGSLGVPYLWLGPIPISLPFSVTFGGVFLVLTAIYAAFFALAAWQGKSLISAMLASLRGGVSEFFSNRALLTLISIGFLVFTAGIVNAFVTVSGSTVGNPFVGIDPLRALLGFTLAPLREEFGFRVLLIGAIAFFISLWRGGKVALMSLWRPSASYEGADNNTALIVVVGVAGALSSGVFGVCHVACGGTGWDIGKLPEATYGGVVLAYLYIKFGFHVAVLAHWGVDYLSSVFAFFGQGAFGVPWASEPAFSLQQLVAVDLYGAFGVASFLVVMYVGARKISAARSDPIPSVS